MKPQATSLTTSGLDPNKFIALVDGKPTRLYILRNIAGAEACITNYGGIIVSLMMPDRKGAMANVVLGMEDIDGVMNGPEPYLGAAIGRYANRIANASFEIDGVRYHVTPNQGNNCLHGGKKGFHAVVWEAEQSSQQTLVLRYTSRDGEEGFPGNLSVKLSYTLGDNNELLINYLATTDKPTVCNLTNHAYFNLAGVSPQMPTIEDHILTIPASYYCPIDKQSIPYGHYEAVAHTPFDFRIPRRIGEYINDPQDEQLKNGAGYDHSYVLDASGKEAMKIAAFCEEPKSGRTLTVSTTAPGLQLYTGNWLSGFNGQHGCTYGRRSAVCFEAQMHPDTPNQPEFGNAILYPGDTYEQTIAYRFNTR